VVDRSSTPVEPQAYSERKRVVDRSSTVIRTPILMKYHAVLKEEPCWLP